MSHSHEDKRFPHDNPRDERLSDAHSHGDFSSDDLRHVADALRDGRPRLDPLSLDRVKLRAMSAARRSGSAKPRGAAGQRLATLLTLGLLVLGTGGTLALAGGDGGSGSAAFDQYKPPCVHGKGAGVPNECPGEKPEPPPCVHGKGVGLPNECPGEKPEPPPCVHGKGIGLPNECPGEKPEKPHGGKGGKGGKGHGGKGGKGAGGTGNGHGKAKGGKGGGKSGKGGKGGKGSHGKHHRHKSKHARKTVHTHH
jgi:hypothetical protein